MDGPEHAPHEPGLHDRDPTGRFSNRAADYARFRPSYPNTAIDAVLSGLRPSTELLAADVGAGTGISARLLADRGVRVTAVEPNESMRSAAEPHPRVTFTDGTAESTGLDAGAFDLVLCAQAFHWFRFNEALAEFARILRAGGRVALVWNQRDERDEFTRSYGEAIRTASRNDPAAEREFNGSNALAVSPLFTGYRRLAFPSVQSLDREGLRGRATSASYVPKDGPRLSALLETLDRIHARASTPDGRAELRYETVVHLCEKR